MGNDEQLVSQASLDRFMRETEAFLGSWGEATDLKHLDPELLGKYFRLVQHLRDAGKHLCLAVALVSDHPELLAAQATKAPASCQTCHCGRRAWIPGDELMPGKGDAGQVFPCYSSCHDRWEHGGPCRLRPVGPFGLIGFDAPRPGQPPSVAGVSGDSLALRSASPHGVSAWFRCRSGFLIYDRSGVGSETPRASEADLRRPTGPTPSTT